MSVSAAPLTLAAPGFSCEGIGPGVCSAYSERFSALLVTPRLRVTTASDVQAVLGMERQRQLLGCSESGCLAELAGALGVDGVLGGTLVKSATGWMVTFKVVRTRDGSTWAQATERLKTDEAFEAYLDQTARRFQAELSPPLTSGGLVRWVPAIAGGVVLIAGLGSFISAKVDAGTLRDLSQPLTSTQVRETADRGQFTESLGVILGSVGLAAIAASVLWVALGPSEWHASLLWAPGGGAAVVGGSF